MERLNFGSDSQYDAAELTVHLARYSLAQKVCRGLDVLDVACGEGYGSYLMASLWGAKSVKGVDVSEEAVKVARDMFSCPNAEFHAAPAEDVDALFAPQTFDLVVSLETIEHLSDPHKFLRAVKKVLKPNGVLILSCPNDHWFYGPGETQNPFHLRSYYFDEFKQEAEEYLGEAVCYLFGRGTYGFGNFLAPEAAGSGEDMGKDLKDIKELRVNQIDADRTVSIENSLYYVGVWGDLPIPKEELAGGSFYPVTAPNFTRELEGLRARVKELEEWTEGLQSELNKSAEQISGLDEWIIRLQTSLRDTENRALELEKYGNELEKTVEGLQSAFEQSQNDKQELEASLADSKKKIDRMEASAFWKMKTFLTRSEGPAKRGE